MENVGKKSTYLSKTFYLSKMGKRSYVPFFPLIIYIYIYIYIYSLVFLV